MQGTLPATRAAIDTQVEHLTSTIQQAVQQFIPQARQSEWQKPYWTAQCTAKVKAARKARRAWTTQQTQASWEAYTQACQEKKAQIRRDKMIGWRATVAEAAADPTKLWKFAKWARSGTQATGQAFPPLQDPGGGTAHTAPQKAAALAAQFFPSPAEADLSDIDPHSPWPEPVPLEQRILAKEVQAALNSLPSKKAPGPDKIPNELLKHCSESLKDPLAWLFSACVQAGYHPSTFKASITCVLRKPQKKDYSQPKAYRPIALLNTVGKVLEKILAQRLTSAAEKNRLLPDTQMGARAGRSTISAMELIVEQIHTL